VISALPVRVFNTTIEVDSGGNYSTGVSHGANATVAEFDGERLADSIE
jgi:hypothetical protein